MAAGLIIISPDQLSLTYSFLVLFVIFKLFWRENEPKNLLICLIIFWLTVSLLAPYGAVFNIPLSGLSEGASETIKYAHFLSVTSLMVYALGIHSVLYKLKPLNLTRLTRLLERYDGNKLFWGYIVYSFFSGFLSNLFLSFSGGQMLISLIFLKWVFLAFLIIHTLIFPSNRKFVVILILIELLLSFSGFWASFKDYILVAFAAFFTLTYRISLRALLISVLIFLMTFFISVVWSYSKGEYRMYLTGGERSQAIVQTENLKNISKLWSIVSNDFSSKNFSANFQKGADGLLYRVSYIEYFAMSLHHVPTFIPHEDGKLLLAAFEHIFKPRVLFPNKKVIDDSEITSTYTGRQFSGREQGASFSLGLVPESYVDFGAIYMFVPIFFFGIYIGFIYKFMVTRGYNILWGICYAAPFFNFVISFGVPTTKFLGWSVTYFVGFYFINRYLIKYVDRWLLKKEFR